MSTPAVDSQEPGAVVSRWATGTRFEDVPVEVVRATKRYLLDFLCVVIASADESAVLQAVEAVRSFDGNPQASVLGSSVRSSCQLAALVNGIAAHSFDAGETPLPTMIHLSGPTMAAALAVGERQEASGKELIAAIGVGFELECRLGLAKHPRHDERGWHVSGRAGAYGSAVAAGRLLGLDAQQMRWALGMAGGHATGEPEQFGSEISAVHAGKAAADGVLSAVLASHGLAPTEEAFGGHIAQYLTEGLGQRWEFKTVVGSGFDPISDAELRERVHDMLWAYVPKWKEQRLLEIVDRLEGIPDVGVIAELLEPAED